MFVIANRLSDYASYNTSTYGTATFTDSETQAVVHRDRRNQGNNHFDVVAWHYHLYKECHALLKRKGARATIRPRKNAALWEEGHPLNEAVLALKAGELKEWKRASGYHQRSKAETAMYRFKQLISSKLSLRNYNAQVGEALAGVKAMNKMTVLGMPVRQLVN